MPAIVPSSDRHALLTAVEKPTPAKAKLGLTRREESSRTLRKAVDRSGLKLNAIGDHGQVSRQIGDKENLNFHAMVATWPIEVWRELIPLLAVQFGFRVVQEIRRESA